MTDVLIIGAGTAGLTAAIYAARAGKSVSVLEAETVGGQISSSPRVENFPGTASMSGAEFSDRLFEQALAFGIEFDLDEVSAISKEEAGFVLTSERGKYEAKSVILALGAKHRKLGVDREDELSGISYCAVCDGAFYKGKTVAVVGGGSAALQSAELLSGICEKVYLIHRRDEFRGESVLASRLSEKENVEFVLNSSVSELLGDRELSGLRVVSKSGEARELPVSGLFVAIGQSPSNEKFKNIAELDEAGYIIAGEDCRTKTPGVFAAGDCRTKAIRQLTTAAADGTVAAMAACEFLQK